MGFYEVNAVVVEINIAIDVSMKKNGLL